MGNRRAARPELFLPWPKFEGRRGTIVCREEPQAEAFPIAERFHPRWHSLKQGAQKLHARNVHQVVGPDVTNPTPSRFVLCWTPGGAGGGGRGRRSIAQHYGVRIFDLAVERDRDRVNWLTKFGWERRS
jgi:hypothetical protein